MWGAPSLITNGCSGLFHMAKQPKHAVRILLCSKVKNTRSFIFIRPIRLHLLVLRHRNNFILYRWVLYVRIRFDPNSSQLSSNQRTHQPNSRPISTSLVGLPSTEAFKCVLLELTDSFSFNNCFTFCSLLINPIGFSNFLFQWPRSHFLLTAAWIRSFCGVSSHQTTNCYYLNRMGAQNRQPGNRIQISDAAILHYIPIIRLAGFKFYIPIHLTLIIKIKFSSNESLLDYYTP
jgi:hypothetical protein